MISDIKFKYLIRNFKMKAQKYRTVPLWILTIGRLKTDNVSIFYCVKIYDER